MIFVFHAAPPPGEWINDPNGLVFADGRYRLFAQHSAAAPDYKAIGWARASSDDLLHWDWDGAVIAPDVSGLAYSGSVAASDDVLTATLTRHAPPVQRQYRLTSDDAGLSWQQDDAPLGPEGRNVRDPFVFECAMTGDRRMLLAEPCDWTDWASDPPSRLSVWREGDGNWERVGSIGPWSPPGVMWEVPVLLDFGDLQVLIISMVDRRDGGARCSVRYWVGKFDSVGFDTTEFKGTLLDYGPDYYATCVNTVGGWPSNDRVMVGWASNWATARTMPWQGGMKGGPIGLPRVLSLVYGRLRQHPIPAACPRATRYRWASQEPLHLMFSGETAQFDLDIDADGRLRANRSGNNAALVWECDTPSFLNAPTEIIVFVDQGLIELFFEAEGKALTIFVPGANLQEGQSE